MGRQKTRELLRAKTRTARREQRKKEFDAMRNAIKAHKLVRTPVRLALHTLEGILQMNPGDLDEVRWKRAARLAQRSLIAAKSRRLKRAWANHAEHRNDRFAKARRT